MLFKIPCGFRLYLFAGVVHSSSGRSLRGMSAVSWVSVVFCAGTSPPSAIPASVGSGGALVVFGVLFFIVVSESMPIVRCVWLSFWWLYAHEIVVSSAESTSVKDW